MQKNLLLSIAVLFALNVQGQIVLTKDNVPHSPSYDDVRHRNSSGIPLPAYGANITYDYTVLPSADSMDVIPYIPATRDGFTAFTRFNYGFASLQNIPLFSEYYTHITDEGVGRVGSYKLEQRIGIGAISGNPNDSLIFPGNNTIFQEYAFDLKFPATYGDAWSSNYAFHTDFLLTVSAFGLNNMPGYQKQYISQSDSVVGYGQLTLPFENGVSIPYEVLLVKNTRLTVDSLFLNGQPAPPAILAAFGLTQGAMNTLNRYIFYAEGFERPLLLIEMSSDGSTPITSYYGSNGFISSTSSPAISEDVFVYPNPARSASMIHFQTPQASSSTRLKVYNRVGSLVGNTTLTSDAEGKYSWNIPQELLNGSYFYILSDEKGQMQHSGKLIIQE